MRVLGIETSCDETAIAVVEDGRRILSNVIASQVDMHARYGGVVPEVASRQHVLEMVPVLEEALGRAGANWEGVDAIAVTNGPGLAGALLVGVNTAKALALATGLPPDGDQPPGGPRLRQLARRGRSGVGVRLPADVPHRVGRTHGPAAHGGPRPLHPAGAHA